ncbi:uncharacterized protein KZ484_000858 isoform 1-T2 [Pholidichthys leucotaenia]
MEDRTTSLLCLLVVGSHVSASADFQYPLFMNWVGLKDSQMMDRDLSLVLKNVTFKDSETYECRVHYPNSNSREKRSMRDTDSICIIPLKPEPPGGRTWDQVIKNGSPGLIAGLTVAVVLLIGFVF